MVCCVKFFFNNCCQCNVLREGFTPLARVRVRVNSNSFTHTNIKHCDDRWDHWYHVFSRLSNHYWNGGIISFFRLPQSLCKCCVPRYFAILACLLHYINWNWTTCIVLHCIVSLALCYCLFCMSCHVCDVMPVIIMTVHVCVLTTAIPHHRHKHKSFNDKESSGKTQPGVAWSVRKVDTCMQRTPVT